MKTRLVATKLSPVGRRRLAEFLAANLNDRELVLLLTGWEDDVAFTSSRSPLEGRIEVGGIYTRTGAPVICEFSGDEVELEAMELDDDEVSE